MMPSSYSSCRSTFVGKRRRVALRRALVDEFAQIASAASLPSGTGKSGNCPVKRSSRKRQRRAIAMRARRSPRDIRAKSRRIAAGDFEMELGIGTQRIGGLRAPEGRAVLARRRARRRLSASSLAGVDDGVGRDVRHAALARESHELQVALRLLRASDAAAARDRNARRRARASGRASRAAACAPSRASARSTRPSGPPESAIKPSAAAVEILQAQARVAFAAAHLRARDQLAEIRVAALVFDQEHDARAVFEGQLAADDRGDSRADARRLAEAHRSVETVAIGQRDRRQFRARPRARSVLRDATLLARKVKFDQACSSA